MQIYFEINKRDEWILSKGCKSPTSLLNLIPLETGVDGVSLLVSRKLVCREVCSGGSRTTNVGTDGQEWHMRLYREGKVAHHTNAYKQRS